MVHWCVSLDRSYNYSLSAWVMFEFRLDFVEAEYWERIAHILPRAFSRMRKLTRWSTTTKFIHIMNVSFRKNVLKNIDFESKCGTVKKLKPLQFYDAPIFKCSEILEGIKKSSNVHRFFLFRVRGGVIYGLVLFLLFLHLSVLLEVCMLRSLQAREHDPFHLPNKCQLVKLSQLEETERGKVIFSPLGV